jgi:biopolymer transport protein TolR
MARNFRRHRTAHPIADLNVTNLIDLGFMLLIIFMVVASMAKQEQTLPVDLPRESASTQKTADSKDKFETITIRADGSFLLGSRPMNPTQLAKELEIFAKQPKPPVFRIRGDSKAVLQYLVIVLDELKKAGLTRISIDTQVSGSE